MGIGSTTANLILTARTATSVPALNTPAAILANLKDAANILPLANVTARVQVLSGPNAGLRGQGLNR